MNLFPWDLAKDAGAVAFQLPDNPGRTRSGAPGTSYASAATRRRKYGTLPVGKSARRESKPLPTLSGLYTSDGMSILAGHSVPNPWQTLPFLDPPHVFGEDARIIDRHNLRYPQGHKHHIYLNAYPEPYIGDPNAPILLLNRNPGYGDHDPRARAHPTLEEIYRQNLLHGQSDYPFYPIGPTYAQHHKSTWWRQSLRHWIDLYGARRVARAFFCVESMPYHSTSYRSLSEALPSHRYALSLVVAKIKAGALLIVMRGYTDWSRAVAEAGESLERGHLVKNVQTKSLSPESDHRTGNLAPATSSAVDRILSAIS